MKKLLLSLLTLLFITPVFATDFDLFYSPSCGHCHHAMEFLNSTLKTEYPNVNFKYHNVATPVEANLMKHFATKLNVKELGVPFVVVGNEYTQGYGPDTAQTYRNMLDKVSATPTTKPAIRPAEKQIATSNNVPLAEPIVETQPNTSFFTPFNTIVGIIVLILFALLVRKYKKKN